MSYFSKDEAVPLRPLKWYKRLAAERGRLEAGVFLVEGHRAVKQIIDSHPDEVSEIITTKELPVVYHSYHTRLVSDGQFRSICSTKTPQGPLAVVRVPPDMYSAELPENVGTRVLLLEDIQDPGNVGTLIRTAAAFDYSGVILTGKCADPLSPKCVQSSAGTVLALWIRRTARYIELAKSLQEQGFSLVAADLEGAEYPSILGCRDKLLLALGNEASGLSKLMLDASDCRFRIPIVREKAESLNVAASGAICMYLSSLSE